MMAWWDRTHGDSRGACNSVYIHEGEMPALAMEIAKEMGPT